MPTLSAIAEGFQSLRILSAVKSSCSRDRRIYKEPSTLINMMISVSAEMADAPFNDVVATMWRSPSGYVAVAVCLVALIPVPF